MNISKSILSLLLLLVQFSICLGAHAALDGEKLFTQRKNAEACLAFADHKDPLLAMAAMGGYLRAKRQDIASEEVADNLKAFIQNGRDVDKTAMLVSLIAEKSITRGKIAEALMGQQDTTQASGLSARSMNPGYRLAAAILAYNAIEMDLYADFNNRKSAGHLALPPQLLGDVSDETKLLALTAAAYAGDAAVEQQLVAVDIDTGTALGAKLLYMAKTGMDVSDQIVDYVFGRALARSRTARVPLRPGARNAPSSVDLFELVPPGGAMAAKAVAVLKNPKYIPCLQKALFNDDVKVQIEAVRAIETMWQDGSQAVLLRRLGDCEWPLAIEICDVLKRHPDGEAVPALINRLHGETGYLRQHLVHTLSAIAGGQKGQTAEDWKNWWLENRNSFTADPVASKEYLAQNNVANVTVPTVGFFYGLPIYSDHFIYVVDSSKSMRGERIKSLRENMIESINGLKPVASTAATGLAAMRGRGSGQGGVFFNIADFGGRVEIMEKGGLSDDKGDGEDYTQEMPLTLGTRMFDALDLALSIEEADSFYLLSDGAPVAGELERWDKIIGALRFMTRYRPVAVHCVAFSPSSGNERKMKEIAENHYGLYGTAN